MTKSILFKKKKLLPTKSELAFYMWEKGCDFSYISDSASISRLTFLSLCWNSWVDDKRLTGVERHYIEFSISKHKNDYILKIDLIDATFEFNKRAFHRAIYLAAKRTEGMIIDSGNDLLDSTRYLSKYRNLLELSLESSVILSLKPESRKN